MSNINTVLNSLVFLQEFMLDCVHAAAARRAAPGEDAAPAHLFGAP